MPNWRVAARRLASVTAFLILAGNAAVLVPLAFGRHIEIETMVWGSAAALGGLIVSMAVTKGWRKWCLIGNAVSLVAWLVVWVWLIKGISEVMRGTSPG